LRGSNGQVLRVCTLSPSHTQADP